MAPQASNPPHSPEDDWDEFGDEESQPSENKQVAAEANDSDEEVLAGEPLLAPMPALASKPTMDEALAVSTSTALLNSLSLTFSLCTVYRKATTTSR